MKLRRVSYHNSPALQSHYYKNNNGRANTYIALPLFIALMLDKLINFSPDPC